MRQQIIPTRRLSSSFKVARRREYLIVSSNCRFLTRCIPETTGLVAYYDTFLSSLHATSPQYWEVIGLGHLGHSPKHPAAASSAIGWRNSTNGGGLPSLQDQIDSKVDFIDSLRLQFDEEARIILLGHSVGAYICQELMKKRPKLVHAMYGLFPTITHIADTPNGRR